MNDYSQQIVIDASHPSFDGHFPDNPLLPGAVLLLQLQQLIEAQLPEWQLEQVRSAKFLAPVRPGDTLAVQWQADDAQQAQSRRVRLQASVDARQVCQASLILKRRPELQ